MIVTTSFITYVQLFDDVQKQSFAQKYWPAFIPALILALAIEIVILCCHSVARKVPVNFILLAIFTISFSFVIGFITLPYSAAEVIQAGGATAITTVALTIYAMTTKHDYTYCGALPWIFTSAFLSIILVFSLLTPASVAAPFFIGLIVIVYGFFLVHDTQLIAGKSEHSHHKLGLDDYIIGALIIYLDIIVLFIRLLAILGRK